MLGLPDPDWGEAVAAFVVLRPGASVTRESLNRFCGERLAGYKKPKLIEFVESLPRNLAGKVTKHVLRERHLSGRTGD